jgi:predicted amidohydrolase YtcJ
LMKAGIAIAGSTDAPFGAPDPWAAMRAAVTRAIGPSERIPPHHALQMFLGWADRPATPRTIAPGEPGDLCILAVPPSEALRVLTSDMVVAAVVGGELVGTA